MAVGANIKPIRIDDEMRTSYMTYAMSVIVSRALPDVRDGLKPVQRRILNAMHELGLSPGSSYKKSARIVGDVVGKYHPHGDTAVYDALVRLAQDFSMRVPLVDGQGNFGSVDNDPPAAMRYTEARLRSITQEMITDIERDTVDFVDNYDGSLKEPSILPALIPNMLVNGASGIAVGMATNIPPHNLGEVCDAVIHMIDDPEVSPEELMEHIPGPDFPTGSIIRGRSGIIEAYTRGQGSVVVQAKTDVEELKNHRSQIIVTELPFQVNKASLVEKIAQLARDRKIEGISDVRDESDRSGMRVVVELKRDVDGQIVLNNLYTHTSLQSSFHVMMLALVDYQPQILSLKRSLSLYISHRQIIVTRRSQYLLNKAKERAHVVEGLRIAIGKIELVISIVRQASSVEEARTALMDQLALSEIQAQAILDMQLRRLAGLEREKLEAEHNDLQKTISDLEGLLADVAKILTVVRNETKALKDKFADVRRTEIDENEPTAFSIEERTPHQDVIVTLSSRGYVKRIPLSTYKLQHRGGKGVKGQGTREGDILQALLLVDTHDTLLFFTDKGRVYPLKCYQISQDSSRTTRGTPLINLVPATEDEKVQAVVGAPDLNLDGILVLGTKMGEIKTVSLVQLAKIRARGLNIMDLEDGDELISVRLSDAVSDVIMVTKNGMSIRFPVNQVRRRSRAAGGVRGIRLSKGDSVVSMEIIKPEDRVLLVTKWGYGKLVRVANYRFQSRGGKGTIAFKTSGKTGKVAAARVVPDGEEEVLIVSTQGQIFRTSVSQIPQQGRHTRGAIAWKANKDDSVASIECFTQRRWESQLSPVVDSSVAPGESEMTTEGEPKVTAQKESEVVSKKDDKQMPANGQVPLDLDN